MSFWRQSIVNSSVMVFQAGASRVSGMFVNAILARLLTPTQWGTLNALSNASSTLTQVLKLSIDAGLQIRLSEQENVDGRLTRGDYIGSGTLILAGLALIALIAGFGGSELVARWFGDPSLAPWLGLAGIGAAAQLASQLCAVLVGFGLFKIYALINTAVSVGYLAVLGAAYVCGGRGLWIAIATLLASQLGSAIAVVAYTFRAARKAGVTPRLSRFRAATADLLRLGLPMHAAAAVPALAWFSVTAELAKDAGLESLATLRIVATFNQMVSFIPTAIAQTFITQFAAARGASDRVPATEFLRYVRVIVVSSTVTALGVMFLVPIAVPIIFGDTYSAAAKLVPLGLMTATVLTVKQAVLVGLISERRTGYALIDTVVASSVFLVLARVLMPSQGVHGFLISELAGHLTATAALGGMMTHRLRGENVSRQAFVAGSGLLLGLVAMAAGVLLAGSSLQLLLSLGLVVAAVIGLPSYMFTTNERAAVLFELRGVFARVRR